VKWLDTAEASQYVSVLTLAEIEKELHKEEGKRRRDLQRWVDEHLPACFAGHILAFDARVASRWAHLTASLLDKGWPLPTLDSQIAATALAQDLVLVTREGLCGNLHCRSQPVGAVSPARISQRAGSAARKLCGRPCPGGAVPITNASALHLLIVSHFPPYLPCFRENWCGAPAPCLNLDFSRNKSTGPPVDLSMSRGFLLDTERRGR
jgi:predicted nucleic acid-binding protein